MVKQLTESGDHDGNDKGMRLGQKQLEMLQREIKHVWQVFKRVSRVLSARTAAKSTSQGQPRGGCVEAGAQQ